MKRLLGLFVAAAFIASASLALAKDYQVTGPVVDVTNDQITVKKGADNWEIARDKDTKTTGGIKKGDRVMIKYKMIAASARGTADIPVQQIGRSKGAASYENKLA